MTETEKEFRLLWEDARNAVLNNGNNQLRKCIADLESSANNTGKRYTYKFYKRDNHEN